MAAPNSPAPLPSVQPRSQTGAGHLADAFGQWSRAAVAALFWSAVVTIAAALAFICALVAVRAVSIALKVLGG